MQQQKTSEPLNKNLALICVTVIVLCVVILVWFFNKPEPSNSVNNNTGNIANNNVPVQQQPRVDQPSGIVKVSIDDDPAFGSKNAPLTLIEFSDFQCPFCRLFWRDTLPQITKEYIDTGKLKFVYRDFPLSSHPAAEPSAQAAECADDQGKFLAMHDKIFQEQAKQGQGTVQFTSQDIKTWASQIGLNTLKFNQCLDSGKYADEVEKDLADGSAAGIEGTPGFFIGKSDSSGVINGTLISGAQPFSAFKAVIDQILSE